MTDYFAILFATFLILLFGATYAFAQEPTHTTAWYEAHASAAKAQYRQCMKRVNARLESGGNPIDVSTIWTHGECKQVAQAIHHRKIERKENSEESASSD